MIWLTIWWNGVLHAEFSVIDKVSLVLQLAGTTSGSIHQSAKSAIQDCTFIFLYKLRLETAQGSLHNSWGNNSLKLLTKAWLGRTICIAGLETMLVVKNKSISLLLELDSVFMSIVFEKFYCIEPTWPPCHLVANQEYSYFDKGFRPARCYSINKTRRQYLLCELQFNSLYIFPNKYHFNLKHTNLTIICSLFCIGSCCLV